MKESLSDVWRLASALLGIAVFVSIMWWAASTHARLWRLAGARNPQTGVAAARATRLDTIVIARRTSAGQSIGGAGSYRQYAGTIVAVEANGLTFSSIAPLSVFCRPFSVPFDRIELRPTDWALWPDPFALRIAGQPDFEIIVGRDTVQWIREHADRPPFGFDR